MADLQHRNSTANAGARPEGAASEQEAAAAVRAMFDEIAPRYDFLNHVLSLNIDRLWWWRTARRFRTVLAQPEARVLDICCGTGDMTMALLRRRPRQATPVLAADFSHGMLVRGARKFTPHGAFAIEADAMQLPLAAGSCNLVTTAFGFRNLRNYNGGLAEFLRVLAPGGRWAYSTLQNPVVCWASCTASTSGIFCRRSVSGFPVRPARMRTCPLRSAAFPPLQR